MGQICLTCVALPESHAKSTVESLNHFPNHSRPPIKLVRSWPRVLFSQRSWLAGPLAQLRLGPLCGPLGAAANRLALRASGIAEEGEYARELTKFYTCDLLVRTKVQVARYLVSHFTCTVAGINMINTLADFCDLQPHPPIDNWYQSTEVYHHNQ